MNAGIIITRGEMNAGIIILRVAAERRAAQNDDTMSTGALLVKLSRHLIDKLPVIQSFCYERA